MIIDAYKPNSQASVFVRAEPSLCLTFSGREVISIELALSLCVLLIVVGGPVLLVPLHGDLV